MKSVKILWLSRHELTEEQKDGLTRVFPDSDISIDKLDQTINEETIKELVETDHDAFAVVLPAKMLALFFGYLKHHQKLIVPLSKRVLVKDPNGGESKVQFVYDGWEVIDDLVYESHLIK